MQCLIKIKYFIDAEFFIIKKIVIIFVPTDVATRYKKKKNVKDHNFVCLISKKCKKF